MNKREKEFKEYLLDLLVKKKVWLSDEETTELDSNLEKLGPPYPSTKSTKKKK